ncbi:type 1 glutamine amidotransferase domain-containing protein [Metabacillus indicus]|uniref:type 1 glutamine amidotransferase domain-containing protein n=1 Tax=Metabacillus indicus TaxID=246786 RepID=UPI002A04C652|nr:type 1 glutamine amidotransferase domain-containing protein [Metabacillus indicus]MDX8291549.1 type 1 glutamine amidotransferase domain-containing protein [Metabacillus indicus]
MANVLMVVSNAIKVKSYETGYWSEEFHVPLMALEDAGHKVTIASPKGGDAKVDTFSLTDQWDPHGVSKAFEELGRWKETKRLSDLSGKDFDAVVFVGGHGPMFDVAYDAHAHRIINEIYDNGGIVAAECHAPAVLAFTVRPDGTSIIQGKKVTSYPDVYEPENVLEFLPYSVEQELSKVAEYVSDLDSPQLAIWADDQIITSRDPVSSEAIANELLKALDK